VITFKVISPDGDRTITFAGRLDGDEIVFSREVAVRRGGSRGANDLFGVNGPKDFVARKTP
jgi:hypothetical protein